MPADLDEGNTRSDKAAVNSIFGTHTEHYTSENGLICYDRNMHPHLVYSDRDELDVKFLKYMKYMQKQDGMINEWFRSKSEVTLGVFARMINNLEWHKTNAKTGSSYKGMQLTQNEIKALLMLVVGQQKRVTQDMLGTFPQTNALSRFRSMQHFCS